MNIELCSAITGVKFIPISHENLRINLGTNLIGHSELSATVPAG